MTVFAALLLSGTVPAIGAPIAPHLSPEHPASVRLTPEQLFEIAERHANAGRIDTALSILKILAKNPDVEFRSEARVRLARLLQTDGQLKQALVWYDQLLDEKPDAAGVRIERAQLLAAMGKEDAAARELRRAEAAGLPPDVARVVRNAANAFSSNAGFAANMQVGVAQSSNINNATSDDSVNISGVPFQLSRDARRKSGIGVSFNGDLAIRKKLTETVRLTFQLSASGNAYRDSTFNDMSFAAGVGPDINIGSTRLRPAVLVGRRFYGHDILYDFHGGSLTSQFRAGRSAIFVVSGSLTQFEYASPYAGQTGHARVVAIAYERAISPRFAIRTALEYSSTQTADPALSSKGPSIDLAASRDIGHVTMVVRGSYRKSEAEAPYPFFAVTRRDRTLDSSFSLLFRQWRLFGLSPQLSMGYTRSHSSIALFDYSRLRSDFALTKHF